MGKRKKPLKVVLDTNIIVSTLLFEGRLEGIRELWREGEIEPYLTEETFEELVRVLHYPRFSLSEEEINALLYQEILPYFKFTESKRKISGVCEDPEDDKFLTCGVNASADYLISGDSHLLNIKNYGKIKIVSPSFLLKKCKK